MQITWLGHGTFQFQLPSGEVIVMDSWIAFNPKYPEGHEFSRVDAILITHGHSDHIHDAVPLAQKFSPQVVAIYETCLWLEAMRNALTFRCDSGRLTPAGPGDPACGNVQRRLNVGVRVATGGTREHVPTPDTQRAALGASLACIGGVHVFDLDSASFGFVGDEHLKLAKRPAGHHPVGVLVEDLRSPPNACEPFHPDRSGLCAFGFGDDGLTEIVIPPRDAAALTSGLPAQRLAGTPVVSGLQRARTLWRFSLNCLRASPACRVP